MASKKRLAKLKERLRDREKRGDDDHPRLVSEPLPKDQTWNDVWTDNPWQNDSPPMKDTSYSRTSKRDLVDTSFESASYYFNDRESKPDPLTKKPDLVETSFDSSLQYSSDDTERFQSADKAFDTDPRNSLSRHQNEPDADNIKKISPPAKEAFPRILMKIEERLSILFDNTSTKPTCRVLGFVYATPPKRKIDSFFLGTSDRKGHIERWEEQSDVCRNVTATFPHLDDGVEVFRISMANPVKLDAPVLAYSCSQRLSPIPILLKTKVQRNDNVCRVGLRIRSNPNNNYFLTQIAVFMVVPPDVDGEKVTMSRKGGVWDEMKRTISWTIDKLEGGETIDIQAQFGYMDGVPTTGVSKFPVLVHCMSGKSLFSKLELAADFVDDGACKVNLQVEKSSSVLFRKV